MLARRPHQIFLEGAGRLQLLLQLLHYPRARGRSRSGRIADLAEQARRAAADGGKEIVITGVNIGDFGYDTGERFIDLLRCLDSVEGIERYRISSIEPDLLTDDVIEFCAGSKHFMPHFHIPLQSGSDEMLKLMRRHYDRQLFADKVAAIKRLIPDAFIGVDLITGMRGETPEIFEDSRSFVDSLDITRLRVLLLRTSRHDGAENPIRRGPAHQAFAHSAHDGAV